MAKRNLLEDKEKRKEFTRSLYEKYYGKNSKEYDDNGDPIAKKRSPKKMKPPQEKPKKPKDIVEKVPLDKKKIEKPKKKQTQSKQPEKKKQIKKTKSNELGGLFRKIP